MDYTKLFHSIHPGFFQEDNIRALPRDWVFSELVMDLRRDLPNAAPAHCPNGITFGEYRGELAALQNAVRLVDEDWVQYFQEGYRFYCAFDEEKIVAFCSLSDMGQFQDLHIGGPGCVGTIPEYRRQGIGLEMVRLATETLRQDGYDLSWIHYTHLAHWYMKLGYQPVLRWNSDGILPNIEIHFDEVKTAISVMREVAAWGRDQGYRVWPDEWLTEDKLITSDAQPENFCIGMMDNEIACAFILQWSDGSYWPNAPKYEAAYLHKFCVLRKFAGMGMTTLVTEAIRAECRKRGIRYIRLNTGLDEKVVRKIYLSAGYNIVDIIDYPNGRSMALYELEV